jgi:hypothetical protein
MTDVYTRDVDTVRALLLLTLLLLPAVAVAADSAGYDRFVADVRSDRPGKRRAALAALLAEPSMVPKERRDRVTKLLLHVLDKDRVPELRGLAARCLASHRSTETDLKILHRLREERTWRAQRPMISALTGLEDDTVVAWMEKQAFREPRVDVRALLVEALGRPDHPRAYEALVKIAGVRIPWPVAQAAAIALGRHPRPESVDALIDLLWSDRPGVRAAAHESLVRLTGQRKLPAEPAAWVKWWGESRVDFVFPGRKKPPTGDATKTVTGGTVTVPTYYDVPIRGKRVIFCLDVSASMWGQKFDAAKAELSRVIRTLPVTYRFNVIFFNEHPAAYAEEMIPAFPFQKLECVASFEELETKKFTNIFDTLERALGFAGIGRFAKQDPPGVDDIFILTDGEPNRGRRKDLKGIVSGLARLDPKKRVRIHTVSIGEDPREIMKAIAAGQGGAHVHVPAKK